MSAFEDGLKNYSWWPDWKDECVAIVASGESTKRAGVERTKDRIHVFAVKKNIEILPWAEAVYGCDEAWWHMVKGLPKYSGVKLGYALTLFDRYKDIHRVRIEERDEMLMNEPLKVGSGGNSGFQALNLAVQFGARHIALVGYDMGGEHWYGRNKPPMNNPAQTNFDRWVQGFEKAVPSLKKMGIEVINCSARSRISCFPKMTLDETLEEWGL